ncbi:putative membrane protein [Janthinobacterium agaricidamnosum NBRC 102515 = DSM 9628]|uniref:Putative membrane protein n=1 Tax=Janthinobacterium agaricidamnosum NBRC 102515 = DSM 9628 TaxID=1349767 RepID=W0V1S4_9BURK|nr:putative membrane protein [Janthinobacterium agaricidamnosum NBRC 102515 = DSM 9628]
MDDLLLAIGIAGVVASIAFKLSLVKKHKKGPPSQDGPSD